MRVLIADDDLATRLILEGAVEDFGHHPRAVRDGEEALRVLQSEPVDVVISDWAMPGINGVELCRRIRADMRSETDYIYFIMVTGRTDRDDFLTAMKAQADDYLTKPISHTDLHVRLQVAERFNSLLAQLKAEKLEVDRLNRELYLQARSDPLTGLHNRLQLTDDLEDICGRVLRYRDAYAIALFDVDHFKLYNDQYGHLAGDEVLRRVAHALRTNERQGDKAYRYGGEEFLVLLAGQGPEGAAAAGERLRGVVEELHIPHECASSSAFVTISVGVVHVGEEYANPRELIQRADEALYRAKEMGRNRVVVG